MENRSESFLESMWVAADELRAGFDGVIVDCRFSLADPQAGRREYQQSHIPGAHYLDLNVDMSGPTGRHGGRHPLPDAAKFCARLAALGISRDTAVIAYDDSRLAYAARLWWLMRALGYRPPQLLDGGYRAWLALGAPAETTVPATQPYARGTVGEFAGHCDIAGLRVAQEAGALLVDSREERRYEGLEEPIDPVAGHIPGALNKPWSRLTDANGRLLDEAAQRQHWGDALAAERLVVYCGSGVTACVNLFSLAALGRDDAVLYTGGWSDWCSYL